MDISTLPRVMVDAAARRTLSGALSTITAGLAGSRDVVLARIWLVDAGDVCDTCRFRDECPDRARCLRLVASAGNSVEPGAELGRLDGDFRRFPLGVRKIGRVGATGEPLLLTRLEGAETWIADPAWAVREGVRSCAAQPLRCGDEILGVLAVFDRGLLDAASTDWLRIFADHAAVTIANVRALEQIEVLRARLEEENAYLRDEVTEARGIRTLIGDSPGVQKVAQQIRLVAPTDATVLVTGESGTGKEVVACAIHEQSERRDRPFIRVNCSAVAEGLFESEFFGHVRGAFTGAIKDKPGRFELAHGGTLFLDEIGEVPLALQPKLLRVLQEQEIEPVGDTRARRVDVRIVAATNRDLEAEVAAGRFRRDLYYRLSVFPIGLPPLRERREDIPALVTHLVARAARRLGRARPRVTDATLAWLAAHPWPGNVRELQNVIERALIVSSDRVLKIELPAAPTSAPAAVPAAVVTRAELRRQERASIEAALDATGGRVFGADGAAALLGMKPTTLASRIKALGIVRLARPTRS